MTLERLNRLETKDPRPLTLWRLEAFKETEIESDREIAREEAQAVRTTSDVDVYSDASGHYDHLGAAAVMLSEDQDVSVSQQFRIGPMDQWSVHAVELIGIFYSISLAYKQAHQIQTPRISEHKLTTICCDSMSPLQATRNPSKQIRQQIIHTILHSGPELQAAGIALRLQYMPGRCDDPRNEAAHGLAKDTASPGQIHPFCPLLVRVKSFIRDRVHAQRKQEWRSCMKRSHLRGVNKSLPSIYTRRLYIRLTVQTLSLLADTAVDGTFLVINIHAGGDKCVCSAQRKVVHVLVDCPRLKTLRQELQRKAGDAFNGVSRRLGVAKKASKVSKIQPGE